MKRSTKSHSTPASIRQHSVYVLCEGFGKTYRNGGASQVALVVKNLPAKAGDARDVDSIPGSGRSPGEGNGSPLQYSCLENPIDGGTKRATVHRVAQSQI